MENRHQKDREWERLLRESLSEEKPEKQGLGETGKEGRRIWYILSEQDREIRI